MMSIQKIDILFTSIKTNMRYLTIDTFIKEILEHYKKAKDVYVCYIRDDARVDKFKKLNVMPLLVVIAMPDKKETLLLKELLNLFEESIYINLPIPKLTTDDIACCKISTKAKKSDKFDYYPREYIRVSENVIQQIHDLKNDMTREDEPEVLDI